MYGRYIIRKSVLWSNSDYHKTVLIFSPEVWICIPTNMEVIKRSFYRILTSITDPLYPHRGAVPWDDKVK